MRATNCFIAFASSFRQQNVWLFCVAIITYIQTHTHAVRVRNKANTSCSGQKIDSIRNVLWFIIMFIFCINRTHTLIRSLPDGWLGENKYDVCAMSMVGWIGFLFTFKTKYGFVCAKYHGTWAHECVCVCDCVVVRLAEAASATPIVYYHRNEYVL